MPSIPANTFPAPYDTTAKIISTAVPILLAVAVAMAHSALAGGIAALLLIAAYVYSPTAYTIADQSVVVERPVGSVRVPLDGIREARAATKDDFRRCIRLFGSGGLFGYYGVFLTSKLGRSTWYVTNRSNAVVVITNTKTLVFSPGDVDRFVAAIRPPAV